MVQDGPLRESIVRMRKPTLVQREKEPRYGRFCARPSFAELDFSHKYDGIDVIIAGDFNVDKV